MMRSMTSTRPFGSILVVQRAYAKRGYAHYRNGDFEQAFADFETALRLDPRDASVYLDRAWAYVEAWVLRPGHR